MKKKNWLILSIVAILIAGSSFVLTSSISNNKAKTPVTCCKKIEKQCTENYQEARPIELNMENMSRQFISITHFSY